MRNVQNHTRSSVVRTKFRKSINGTSGLYSPLQKRFAEFLDKDNNVKEFEANVVVSDLELEGTYTTDFLAIYVYETHSFKSSLIAICDALEIFRYGM